MTTPTIPVQSKTLYFKQGASDKVYQASIVLAPPGHAGAKPGYLVVIAYGRRGSTMQTATKTNMAVPLDKAESIYMKIITEKTGEGYTFGPDGTPYQESPKEARVSGFLPMLLNNVDDEAHVLRLVGSDDWLAQEKLDGKRILARKAGPVITGINRKGLTVALPEVIARDLAYYAGDFVIDGEAIGDVYHAFDILEVDGFDARKDGTLARDKKLIEVMIAIGTAKAAILTLDAGISLRVVKTAITKNDKASFVSTLISQNAEGVVFKHKDAPYTAGRPSSGGQALKYKFVTSASFFVTARNAQRSVAIALFDEHGAKIEMGNVSVPPNMSIPVVGSIVDVRYLYAYPNGGHVYQPVLERERDDIVAAACTTGQLKYKRGESDDAV